MKKASDYDIRLEDVALGPKHINELGLNKRLVSYATNRRNHDEYKYHRPSDRLLHVKPKKSIHRYTEHLFRITFGPCDEILKYERKLMIEEYQKTKISKGLWQSALGVKISQYFPSHCGMRIESPPPYFHVWTQADRDLFDSYDCLYFKRQHVHEAFWACFGFTSVVVGQAIATINRNTFVPRSPLAPFFAALIFGGIFPSSWFNIWNENQRKESMHQLLHSKNSFISAKARMIADDTMYPEYEHNREYLTFLERDKYDSFIYSNTDDDVASGNFDKEKWSFVLRENYQEPSTDTIIEKKDFILKKLYIFLGKGFEMREKELQENKIKEDKERIERENYEKEKLLNSQKTKNSTRRNDSNIKNNSNNDRNNNKSNNLEVIS